MHRHRQAYDVLAEMNLTNMIDTAFTLLIAFMLISPSIKHGIQIDLPSVEHDRPQQSPRSVTIVIEASPAEGLPDRIYIDDVRMSLDELGAVMEDKRRRYPEIDVVIEGDRAVRYESFMNVMSLLRGMEFEDVGLITQPVDDETQ